MIAALYVEKGGVYYGLPDVDPWDEERDARNYAGPWPVVAHPPCARWSLLAPLNQAQYGHLVGDDDGKFEAALAAVRQWGGVLEHPAYSFAWAEFDLPRPRRHQWVQSLLDPGWVTEISQSAYGSPTRKRTWLYYVGAPPTNLRWDEPPVGQIVSDLGSGGSRKRGAEWQRGVQYEDAERTTVAFRDALLAIAAP